MSLENAKKVLQEKQCTEIMHEIPKSSGKFSGLAVSQKIRVRKLWSLVPEEIGRASCRERVFRRV